MALADPTGLLTWDTLQDPMAAPGSHPTSSRWALVSISPLKSIFDTQRTCPGYEWLSEICLYHVTFSTWNANLNPLGKDGKVFNVITNFHREHIRKVRHSHIEIAATWHRKFKEENTGKVNIYKQKIIIYIYPMYYIMKSYSGIQ